MSQVKLLLLATNEEVSPVSAVAGMPALSYYMLALRSILRLQPYHDRVFILSNERNHHDLLSWANSKLSDGFPAANILNNGKRGGTCDLFSDVGYAIQTAKLDDSHLIIASLDVLYHPYFNFQRIVEHSIIRAKDTVVFHRPPPGADVSSLALLDLDDFSLTASNPRVLATASSPSGIADGITAAALAPLMVIRKSSLPDLFLSGPSTSLSSAHQGSTHASSQVKQLATLLQDRLIAVGKPVYALELDFCMDTSTSSGLEAAETFYIALEKKTDVDGPVGPAAQALQEVSEAAVSLGVVSRGDERIEGLLASCSAPKKAFLNFYASNWRPAVKEAPPPVTVSAMQAVVSHSLAGTLPDRFADATIRRHNPRVQHPVYQTTSNDYGLKKPTQVEMPDTYAGASQHFSNTFYGGPSKVSCMVTAVTTSKVHKALNEF
ncbi:hypothetical protein CEUSTIGMA_g8818.t1 [Chlamydomonas eustigma]|uniref:Nucleotidyl transferase domain-containing protein n=1 Tax=Chlamydomonas eustigma TaxID=1157962 RepID=A0A250XE79_9CHLO|nr:hypothetical protein CEUSTIGMA_g8818.t1 [Chlamydomonas eustigma]|eukprot:GAX81387.1 hypothetical protein CEUSTIGMA_g8818.t1 [Chlamydomonas eustigma]